MAVKVIAKRYGKQILQRFFPQLAAAEAFVEAYQRTAPKNTRAYIIQAKDDTITTVQQPSRVRTQQIRESKAKKRLQRKWDIVSDLQKKFGVKLTSSFVDFMEYEFPNARFILNDKRYTALNVPEAIFTAWTKGAATCQTDDTGKKKRWWIGKTPSLGAFFNHYIKNKYTIIRGWVE